MMARGFDRCRHCDLGVIVLADVCDGWTFVCQLCGKLTVFSDALVELLVDLHAEELLNVDN